MPILAWNLKCIHLALQGIAPEKSIASVLTVPAPCFGFNPPHLVKTDRNHLR